MRRRFRPTSPAPPSGWPPLRGRAPSWCAAPPCRPARQRGSALQTKRRNSAFDLSFTLQPVGASGELDLEIEYATDLFDPGTISRLADHLAGLLRSALAEPDRRVDELEMLPPGE